VFKPDHEEVLDEAAGVEVAVEPRDDLDRLIHIVGNLVEVQVLGRDELVAQQVLAHLAVPGLPERAAGAVNQHQRHQLAFARLHEGQGFIALVHRAEAAREQGDGIRVADEDQLAGEEILEGDQFFIFANDGVGALLPGQADVDAEALFRAGALMAGLHDARAGAGNDHKARCRNLPAKLDSLLIFLPRGLGPGGAKHGDLAHMRVGGEELEGITQLAQRRLDDAHVAGMLHVL